MARKHARIVQHPFAADLQGALFDSCEVENQRKQLQITLHLRALEHTAPPVLFEHQGVIHERIQGMYIPAQIRFSGVSQPQGIDLYKTIKRLSPEDPARTIEDMLSWQQPGRKDTFYLFGICALQADDLMFFAHQATYMRASDSSLPVFLDRDWSPPPPMPGRLVPQPAYLHRRFGGDPVTFYVETRPQHKRLFIGGTDIQPDERPQVDAVLNLSEHPSAWMTNGQKPPVDRWKNRGEGSQGMSLDEIREEADWVIQRLKQDERVLVHCVAGLNRSTTVCCAVLILLEGLTAEQALARVREGHPWARPDSGHWLKLRWLAQIHRQSQPVERHG